MHNEIRTWLNVLNVGTLNVERWSENDLPISGRFGLGVRLPVNHILRLSDQLISGS
jgi:hypothetical protein